MLFALPNILKTFLLVIIGNQHGLKNGTIPMLVSILMVILDIL